MSDKKPTVFPSAEQIEAANDTGQKINEQLVQENEVFQEAIGNGEQTAIDQMNSITERQLADRAELKRQADLAKKLDDRRAEQRKTVEVPPSSVYYQGPPVAQPELKAPVAQPPAQPPVVPPTNVIEGPSDNQPKKVDRSEINRLSQPQMNQPFDVIELPSLGKTYGLGKKNVKIAYLTTADENILTSPNLVESGDFLEILINRKLLEPSLRYNDLLPGDRNALMIWIRATGYGNMYPVSLFDENNNEFESEVDLNELKTINLNVDPDADGMFSFTLPNSKNLVRFKLLTIGDLEEIEKIAEEHKDDLINIEATLILEKQIVEVDGSMDRTYIKEFVNNMRILDAQKLREYVGSIECGIDLTINVRTPGGGSIETFLPLTPKFFWPNWGI